MIKNKFNWLSVLLTLVIGFIIYFFYLPPINVTSMSFWSFVIIMIVIYLLLTSVNKLDFRGKIRGAIKDVKILIISLVVICFGIIFTNVVLSPVFNSKSYSKRINIVEDTEDSNFITEVEPVNLKSLPLLDKDSSSRLGDRVMGQMPELVSQFYVSDLYTQINYNNDIVRVTPLEYNGFFKYLSNYKEGVKGYIVVNSVDGSSKLVKLEKGMKYMPSAILSKDLDRHLRFQYPTKIFGQHSFEIDNDGNPYWITPVLKYTGVEIREEVKGIVITNTIDGKSKYYDVKDVPSWVDHVYSASLVLEQINDWGRYRNGFLNSIFGQKNVVMATDGYNYTVMNDDVYLYTGITSVSSDESNLGFILINLRTKETRFYSVPGAEEYSAMASAVGQVQQMRYTSTFPLLINLNNRPTYLVSLKDDAGLVKMYALVDVADYQKVVVTDASKGIEAAVKNYLNNVDLEVDENLLKDKTIKIKSIITASIEGNTYYYLTDDKDQRYFVSIEVDKKRLPFLKIGDTLNISISSETEVTEIIGIN